MLALTALDLSISLASGAEAYSIMDEKVCVSLAGVAAPWLSRPPLSRWGSLLDIAEFRLSLRSMLAPVTSFFAIQLAADTVFTAFGMGRSRGKSGAVWYVRSQPSSVVLLLVGWYMATTVFRLPAGN
ncbi:MAG: hypothetical protein AB7F50_01915 [Fimbriimonadaceae bacterium]